MFANKGHPCCLPADMLGPAYNMVLQLLCVLIFCFRSPQGSGASFSDALCVRAIRPMKGNENRYVGRSPEGDLERDLDSQAGESEDLGISGITIDALEKLCCLSIQQLAGQRDWLLDDVLPSLLQLTPEYAIFCLPARHMCG